MSLILGLGRFPGEGHSNPLQYSCLENPMDRGAWPATVRRVAKSRTRLKLLSMRACSLSRGRALSGIRDLLLNTSPLIHTTSQILTLFSFPYFCFILFFAILLLCLFKTQTSSYNALRISCLEIKEGIVVACRKWMIYIT